MDTDTGRCETTWPVGGGTMGALIRAQDWSRTPLGPLDSWPRALRTAVNHLLTTAQPACLAWGVDLTALHNDGFIPILGVRHPEALGRPYAEVWAEFWEEEHPFVEAALAGQEMDLVNRPVALAGRAGRPVSWFTFSWAPLRDDQGAVVGFCCTATETTGAATGAVRGEAVPRAIGEAALRKSEERFGALVRASSEIIYSMNPDWSEMRQLSGGGCLADTPGPIRDWMEKYIDPEDQPACTAAIREAIRTKGVYELEHRVRRADGTLGWVMSRAVPILAPNGAIREWFGVASDVTARRQIEEVSRRSQERLRRALEIETVGVIFSDPDGVIQEANDAFLSFSGFSRADVAEGRLRWQELTPPEHMPVSRHALKELMTTGRATPYEKEYVRKDGSRWWGLFAPRLLDGGEAVEFIIEITERKGIELALRESEARFRLMADAVPAIVWITDAEGQVEFFNWKWSDYTGVSNRFGPAADIADGFIHPDDAAATLERFERARRTGEPFLIEHRVRSKEGDYRWFLARGEPYRDPRSGAILRWFGASVDIHDRKRAEAALRTSEERYRGLVETQADLILRIGADGIFSFANDTTCRVFGVSLAELLRCHWSRFVHPDDIESIRESILEVQTAPDHRTTVEARILTVNGVRWYAWDGYGLFDAAGRFIEKQSVGRDITERKAMETALRQAKEEAERAREVAEQATLAKSKFLAAASHDLRQPMQSLLLFLDVLVPHVAPRGQDALKHLGRGLDALRDLLDSLLDISRLDAGIVQPGIEDFNVAQVVEEIGNAYAPVAAGKGLDLRVTPCDGAVRSDPTLLGRMVRNLVENALRYTETGWIAIDCREAGDTLRIEVADTGIGIPPEHLERIWEEFHQVGNPERDRNRGLGLGLAIVQRLSFLLKHPVEVRSTPGRGSVFTITVPLGRAEPRPVPVPGGGAAAGSAGKGRFAVLVDDDAIVLLGLKAIFDAWGYTVLAASSTDRALAALAATGRRPDIIVADYRLREGRSGSEAILRMREAHGADIPGIILTGETGSEVQRDAAEHKLSIIHKPVTPRQLSMAMESQMRRSGTPR